MWPSAEFGASAKFTREYVVKQVWLSFVEDKIDLDKPGSGDERKRKENNNFDLQSSMWIYTTAAACHWQNHMQNARIFKLRSIMEAVNWVCDDALDEYV